MSRHTGGVSPAVPVKSLTPSKPVQAGARVAARPPPEVGLLPPLPRLVAPGPAGDRHHAVEQEARVGAHDCDPERVAGHLREDAPRRELVVAPHVPPAPDRTDARDFVHEGEHVRGRLAVGAEGEASHAAVLRELARGPGATASSAMPLNLRSIPFALYTYSPCTAAPRRSAAVPCIGPFASRFGS